jgi:Spy/CpxP family protein refolding chaperone
MVRWSRYLLVAVVAFAAALGATWLSRSLAGHGHPEGGALHVLMHEQLNLDTAQQAKIEVLERQFAERRKVLDAQLRQANTQLASAIANEHQYGPKVAEAVDRSHMAMGDLQKATLSHVFAMRAVLRPDQAARFDTAVAKALTRPDDE